MAARHASEHISLTVADADLRRLAVVLVGGALITAITQLAAGWILL